MKKTTLLLPPLMRDNPIMTQMLGICSALAVTTNLQTALTMSIAVTLVLVCASVIISSIRKHIPPSVRLIVQITIIASLVIVIDQILQAWFFDISRVLSIFVGLIVTNCLVLGRAEGFAMHNNVGDSLVDALGNGFGYSLVLMIVAFVRELFGFGTLFGYHAMPVVADGGWFEPLTVMQKAPSAFFIIGLLIWLGNTVQARTAEKADLMSERSDRLSTESAGL